MFILFIHTCASPLIGDATSSTLDCEVYAKINRVIDGDTIVAYVTNVYDENFSEFIRREITVRFADINAPELNTREGLESKDFLVKTLEIFGYTTCLDIDDLRTYDPYGRIIATIYIRYNETHWLNLNKYLVDSGKAYIWDFHDNEFDPYTWSLYVMFNNTDELTHMNRDDKVPSLIELVLYWLPMVLLLIVSFATFMFFIHKRLSTYLIQKNSCA
ncbi:MAG: thermonuclease family protein [Desulfurococcaceae archaeon]